jgi:hypothetical protein
MKQVSSSFCVNLIKKAQPYLLPGMVFFLPMKSGLFYPQLPLKKKVILDSIGTIY